MQQKTVPWDEATLHELKMFAAQVLGMMTMPNIGEATLRAKIRQAYNGENITIMVDESQDAAPADAPQAAPAGQTNAAPPEEPTGKPLRGAAATNDPIVQITIAEIEGAGGKRAVPVGVNGVMMLVPRGRMVPIPYRYYEALLHAVKTLHEQDEETGDIISTEVPAYPFSVNSMPPQETIDAYLAADR